MKINSHQKKYLIKHLKNKLTEIETKQAVITTPYQISNNEIQLLIKKYPFLKDRTLTYEIDPSLIGGYIIVYGSWIIDTSINNQFEKLKDIIFNN